MMDIHKLNWSMDGISCFSARDFFVGIRGQCPVKGKAVSTDEQHIVTTEGNRGDITGEDANDGTDILSVTWRYLCAWRLLDYVKLFEFFGGLAVASGSAIFLLVGRV